MGSGLILLVIVGAWLAVLVPMALRSHDAATSSRSAERFGDAMRVLSPRTSRRSAHVSGPPPALEPLLHEVRDPEPRPPLTLVERRRRVLLSLLGVTAAGLLGGLLTVWLLVPGLVALALAVAYVVHLRRLALAREWRRWEAEGDVEESFDSWVPARLPARPAPLRATLPAPALRYEDPLPLAVGDDGGWSPVPVPPPVYVGKPVAPPRPPRVLDLTEPGRWSEAVTAGELGGDPDLELDGILDGRRAVGDW